MLVTEDYIEIKLIDEENNFLILQLTNYKEDITLQEIKDQLQTAINKVSNQYRWRSPQGLRFIEVDSAKKVHIESNITELE